MTRRPLIEVHHFVKLVFVRARNLHAINTLRGFLFIYGFSFLRWGHLYNSNYPFRRSDFSGHGLHKVGSNLLVDSLLFSTLLSGGALLSRLWVQLREGNVV